MTMYINRIALRFINKTAAKQFEIGIKFSCYHEAIIFALLHKVFLNQW